MSTELADPVAAEIDQLIEELNVLDRQREALVIPMQTAADDCNLLWLAVLIKQGDVITTREVEVDQEYERLVQLREQALGVSK